MKKQISICLVLVMVFLASAFLATPVLPAGTPMKLIVSSETATPGSEVVLTISIEDNPGVTSIAVDVSYDGILTLDSVEFGTGFRTNGQTVMSQDLTSPVTLSWVNGTQNYSSDGVFATLTFTVANDLNGADHADVTVTYDPENIFNVAEQNVVCGVTNGGVTFDSHIPGDINGDGSVNNKDLSRFLRYIAGDDVYVVETALDVNGDGAVNNKDLNRLMKYIAGVPVVIY